MAGAARATIYLEPEIFRAVKIRAAASDVPVSAIVNEALRQKLREDVEDLKAFDTRAGQPRRPFREVIKALRREGLL